MSLHKMRPSGGAYEIGLIQFCENLHLHFVMVEVGCFAGESTRIFASRVKVLYAVDPWLPGYDDTDIGSKVMGKEIEDAFDEAIKPFPSVIKMKMTSKEASRIFSDKSIDVVYIDARHTYEAAKEDIGFWRPKVRIGGIISGHDFCMEPVRRAVLESFDGRVDTTFVDDSWLVRKT